MMVKKAVIVLGMHRSGTSTTSGILSLRGLDLGKSVAGGNASNPRGFFENFRIMEFNEELFRTLHLNWHNTLCIPVDWWKTDPIRKKIILLKEILRDDFTLGSALLFKDPRMCILLPVYLEVFEELEVSPFFIITHREPIEVAESLEKRDAFSRIKSIRLWTDHMLSAERYTRAYPRIFLDYHNILSEPVSVIARTEAEFPLDLPVDSGIEKAINQFVDSSLDHSSNRSTEFNGDDEVLAGRISHLLNQLTCRKMTTMDHEELDQIADNFYSKFSPQKWPGITVITLGGAGSKALEASILSVAGQDYPNLEQIVIDWNTDGAIIEAIEKHKYLLSHWVLNSHNRQLDVVHKALSLASGEWICFLNAGERFMEKDGLIKASQFLTEGCDVVLAKKHLSFIVRSMVVKNHAMKLSLEAQTAQAIVSGLITDPQRITEVPLSVQYSSRHQ